jgi:hypothetical protein
MFKHLPESPVTEKSADGNSHQQFTFLPAIFLLIQNMQVIRRVPATQLLHMPANSLFDPFSDLAITRPAITEVIKDLSKLVIIHDGDKKFSKVYNRHSPQNASQRCRLRVTQPAQSVILVTTKTI